MLFKDLKAVLFDFGGTLDSDGGHWLDRFHEIYLKEGIDLPFSQLKEAFYYADDICCKDEKVNDLKLHALIEYHVQIQFNRLGLKDNPKKQNIAEGFCKGMEYYLKRNAHLLKRLHAKYKLGLVSNFYGNVPVICEEMGISRSLDIIIDSERIGIRKPDPRIFMKAIEALKVDASDAIFVGDSYERDMIPCKRLGMKVVWLKGPKPRIPEDPLPVDAEISNLTQLERLLK